MTNENVALTEHQRLLKQIPEKLGIDFLPVIFRKMSSKPILLSHIWKLVETVLLQGSLHRLTKEMVFVVTANVKKCHYCSTSHKAFARNLGLSKELVDCLDGDLKYIEPASTRHLLEFAHSLASDVEYDSETKFRKLISEGFSESELEELILTVGVASMIATLANGMELNNLTEEEFHKILSD